MHLSEPYLPRRTLIASAIGGLGLLVLNSCTWDKDEPSPSEPDPLEPVLAASVYLAERYTAAIAAAPDLAARLTPLRDGHKAHITALTRELGTADSGTLPGGQPPIAAPRTSGKGSPAQGSGAPSKPGSAGVNPQVSAASPVPLPTERSAMLADLRVLERAGTDQAFAACIAGSRYRAALVGSIAAARASHMEVLS